LNSSSSRALSLAVRAAAALVQGVVQLLEPVQARVLPTLLLALAIARETAMT
jgi:hypothetical protein